MLLFATNPLFEAYHHSDLFGKIIFLSLFVLSVLTWTIFLQKWLQQKNLKKTILPIQEVLARKKTHLLGIDLSSFTHPFCEIYHALKQHTMEALNKNQKAASAAEWIFLSRTDLDWIETQLCTEISHQTARLEKNLFILSTTVTLAPFLGLLGTVWGILLTFAELQAGSAANANSVVMGGLAMALGTTVIGLVVAIPALIAYNYLKADVAHLSQEMENFSHSLLASVELQYRKVDAI